MFAPDFGSKKKTARGGNNREIIMLNIETFKKILFEGRNKKSR